MPTLILWSITILVWAWYLIPRHRAAGKTLSFVFAMGITGGMLSVVPALILNTASFNVLTGGTGRPNDVGTAALLSVLVGLTEETSKAAATVVLMHRMKRLREPLMGVLGATAVALGFASIENLMYMTQLGAFVVVPRALTAVPLHLGLATIWGYGWTRVKMLGVPWQVGLLPAVLLAAGAHAAYDFVLFTAADPALAFYAVLAFSLLMFRTIRRRLDALQQQAPDIPAGACMRCGFQNPAHARFCAQCGNGLEREFYAVCPACGTRTEKSARFCPSCGGRLGRRFPRILTWKSR